MKFKEAKHMLKSYAGMTHKLSDNQGRPKLDQAIDLVLKELEKKDKELEQYKKIIELMADFINMYTLSGEEHHYCHKTMSCEVVGGSRSCIDCIIDWARKEVKKADFDIEEFIDNKIKKAKERDGMFPID